MVGKIKSKRISKSGRAGIIFPVSRIARYLKSTLVKYRIGIGAPVYIAAVMEYLTAEIMELAGNAAKDNKRLRITPRHILLAIMNDEELNRMLKGVMIPSGGVLPKILPELFVKRLQEEQSQIMSLNSTNIMNDVIKNRQPDKNEAKLVKNTVVFRSNSSFVKADALIACIDENGNFFIKDEKLQNEINIYIKDHAIDYNKEDIVNLNPTNLNGSIEGHTKTNAHSKSMLNKFKYLIFCRIFSQSFINLTSKGDENGLHPELADKIDDSINYCLSLADRESLKTIVFPVHALVDHLIGKLKGLKNYNTASKQKKFVSQFIEFARDSVISYVSENLKSSITRVYLHGGPYCGNIKNN